MAAEIASFLYCFWLFLKLTLKIPVWFAALWQRVELMLSLNYGYHSTISLLLILPVHAETGSQCEQAFQWLLFPFGAPFFRLSVLPSCLFSRTGQQLFLQERKKKPTNLVLYQSFTFSSSSKWPQGVFFYSISEIQFPFLCVLCVLFSASGRMLLFAAGTLFTSSLDHCTEWAASLTNQCLWFYLIISIPSFVCTTQTV